jgi:hypothetical protein
MILSFLWTEGVVGNVINISVLSAIEGGKLQFNICAVFAQTLSEMSFISCEDIFWSKFTKFIQTNVCLANVRNVVWKNLERNYPQFKKKTSHGKDGRIEE